MTSSLKVLLIAYECSPYRGSEWAVGWGRLLQAARIAEVHVLTSEANYRDLVRADAEGLLPAGVFFDTPEPDVKLRALEKRSVHFDYNYAAYHHWHRLAFRLAKRKHAEHGFHVAHQTTVCTFREPGYLSQLGIPFLWGPFGGTQNFPPRMLGLLPWRDAIKEAARGAANTLVLRTHPRVRAAGRQAGVIFGATSTTQRDLQHSFQRPVVRLLETGLNQVMEPDRGRFQSRITACRAGRRLPLRLLWSGQLQPRKALPILLRALHLLGGEVPLELDVLGDGPMLEPWRREAAQARVPVRFLGRLPFQNAVARMRESDLFCFTSLRDTSGNVVLEAQAAGVPVLCFNHQGAADMVSPESGVLIPVTTPRDAVTRWAAALRSLAADPEHLLRLSEGATAQARRFLWSENGDRVNAQYRELSAAARTSPVAALVAEHIEVGA